MNDALVDGWVRWARRLSSPNFGARPAGMPIELVVIHAISLPPGEFGSAAIEDFFLNRLDPSAHPYFASVAHLQVSAHFLIRRDGELVQFVSVFDRAWHAGESQWDGRSNCNDFSVGIEFEGCDEVPFEVPQYEACERLIGALRCTLPIRTCVGHADIAPGRKTDPGPCFDWTRIPAI